MLAIDEMPKVEVSEAVRAVNRFNDLAAETGCTEKRLHLGRDEFGMYTLSWDYKGYKPIIILARGVNDREVVLIVKALAAW